MSSEAIAPSPCALAADTKVETPEGPLTIKSVAGKSVAVFTREGARVRFRMMRNVQLAASAQPVWRVTLENGASFRAGGGQVLFRKDMTEVRVDQAAAGELLLPAFHYREGYRFHDALLEQEAESTAALRVVTIEPAGVADLYSFEVNVTGTYFVTAGVLCKAAAAL